MMNVTQEPKFVYMANPNDEAYDSISETIKNNDGYCCCAMHKNDDTKCMCKDFRESMESGFCHCGRFYKIKNYPFITIIHAPADEEHAIELAQGLTTEGFVVLLPFYFGSCILVIRERGIL